MKGNLKIYFKERTIYFYIVSPTTVKAYLHLLVKRINKQSNQNTDFKLKLKSKQHIWYEKLLQFFWDHSMGWKLGQ